MGRTGKDQSDEHRCVTAPAKLLPYRFGKRRHVQSHIGVGDRVKACEGAAREIHGRRRFAKETFQMGSRHLNQTLEEPTLLCVVPCRMPEAFEDFMAFPPVAEIEEVHTVEVPVGTWPVLRATSRRPWFGEPVAVPLGTPSWMGAVSRQEPVGGKRAGRVARPIRLRWNGLLHDPG